MAIDARDRILVADTLNHRVVRIDDMSGRGWTTLGRLGRGARQFAFPAGVMLEGAGRIYVLDTRNNRIVRVDDLSGAGWRTLGRRGNGIGEFALPREILLRPW